MTKEVIKKFVEMINANDEVKGMLKNWTKIAGYEIDGENFYVEHKADGSCEFHDEKPEKANFTMKGPGSVFEGIFTGEKDAQKAFFAKEYSIDGDVMGTMKLLPIIKKLQQ